MPTTRSPSLLFCITLAVVCCACSNAAHASSWPNIDSPPDAQVVWVGKDIVQNGVPMRIKAFHSALGVEEILNFYRTRWDDGGMQQPVENELGHWKVIGKQSDDYYLTVQVKPGITYSSQGFLTVSMLPSLDAPPSLDQRFPRPGGTEVISETDSTDDGRTAKTLIMQNSHSVQSNVSFYGTNLPAQGWRKHQDFNGPSDGHVLYFERRGKACHIAINRNPQGETVILVNLTSTKL